MKNFVILLFFYIVVLSFSNEAQSKTEVKFGINLLSIHTIDRSDKFHQSLDNQGIVMYAKFAYVTYKDFYLMSGKDSAGAFIVGGGYKFSNNFMIIAYNYNKSHWHSKDLRNDVGEILGFIGGPGYRLDISKNQNLIIMPTVINYNIEF